MKATKEQKEQMKRYSQRPDVKEKRKKYMSEYRIDYDRKNKEKIKERKRLYYLKNKDMIDTRNKAWHKNNKDKFMAYRKIYDAINREKLLKVSSDWYYSQNREGYRKKKREWERQKIRKDLNYAIKKRLRLRVLNAFRDYSKNGKIKDSNEYGINYRKIIERLVATLPKDFNEKEYCIDHIVPCCSFDLTIPEQVKKCFAPENHQWLTAKDNGIKIKEDLKLRLIRS